MKRVYFVKNHINDFDDNEYNEPYTESKQKVKKVKHFVVEYQSPKRHGFKWRRWRKYATEKAADQAVKDLNKNCYPALGYVFRRRV